MRQDYPPGGSLAQRNRASAPRPARQSLHHHRGSPLMFRSRRTGDLAALVPWLVKPCLAAILMAVAGWVAVGQSKAPTGAAAAEGLFVDVTAARGVTFQGVAEHTSRKYLIETMGSGVALFDYDNDGRPDIYAVNGAPLNDPTPKGIPDPGA